MNYSEMSIRALDRRLEEFTQPLADAHHALDAAPRGPPLGRRRQLLANLQDEASIVRYWLKIKHRDPNWHHAH